MDSDWRLWNFIVTVLKRTCYDVEVAVGSTNIIHVPVVSNLVIGVRFYSLALDTSVVNTTSCIIVR